MSLVLIIEDEPATAAPVKEALEIEGIQADIAGSGNAGLEMFREKAYDLILLDLKLPGLSGEVWHIIKSKTVRGPAIHSGEEVLNSIRKENPFVTVIVYTNYSDFADIKKLTNIGIDGYINKGPEADLDELIDMIKSKLAPIDGDAIDVLFREFPNE